MHKILKIKAGRHYCSDKIPRLHFYKKKFLWDVQVSSMNKYPYESGTARSEQINKLFGFGAIRHHKRSYRIGWRYNANKDIIELFEYKYEHGIRFYELVDTMKIGQTKKLTVFSPRYIYFGKLLFPYFGGKYPAPQNIIIKLQFC